MLLKSKPKLLLGKRWSRICRWLAFSIIVIWFFIWRLPPFSSSSSVVELQQLQQQQQPQLVVPQLEYFASVDCSPTSLLWKFSLQPFPPLVVSTEPYFENGAKSMKLNAGEARFYNHKQFVSSLFSFDGCVRVFHFPSVSSVSLFPPPDTMIQQIDPEALTQQRIALGVSPSELIHPAKFRVVFSCESSEYFGYQVFANKLAFLQSQQGEDCTWTRLLTCEVPDDLASDRRFPTFTAPPHVYAKRYSPLNKPDVLEKWLMSPLDAPKEKVLVVIDPDSWLLLPLYTRFVSKVRPGFAIGQAAYYMGSRLAQTLWQELCEANCDVAMDLVGVPYVIATEDMKRMAGLWKYYVLKIKYRLERSTEGHAEFASRFAGLDLNWASEMYGYNMASAHVGIKHEVVYDLQTRDIDGSRGFAENAHKASLHMGRAWFPRNSPLAKPYLHTEGRNFAYFGDQVWCKCNFTASTVKPWPIPDKTLMDFQSYHTLRLLHESEVDFGPVPENEEFRHRQGDLSEAYRWTHP